MQPADIIHHSLVTAHLFESIIEIVAARHAMQGILVIIRIVEHLPYVELQPVIEQLWMREDRLVGCLARTVGIQRHRIIARRERLIILDIVAQLA